MTQYVSLYYLPEPRSATMSFLHSPLTLERGCLWTGGTGRHYQTSADILQQGMGASELGQCQHQAGGSGGVGQSYTIYIQTFQVIGEREISGVLRITEQTSSLTPKNRWDFGLFRFSYCESAFREDNLIWFSRDMPALAKKLRTLPILFDLDLASSQEAAQMGNPILNILTL